MNPSDPWQTESLSELFKLFGDSTRLNILCVLESAGELCVCDLADTLGMTKSAISHQLRALKFGNLVKSRKEGKHVFYALKDDHVRVILENGRIHVRGC